MQPPTPTLQIKLHLPVVASAILRPRLLTKLKAVTTHKLTLVSAPAGFGKTTLLASWLAQSEHTRSMRYVWLSLDEQDNDLARFLTYLIAACQQFDHHIGRGLRELLTIPETSHVEAVLTALLNELGAISEETPTLHSVLVLDDYHLLENPRIDEVLTFLLDYLPANLHLVLLSRIDPALPLARMRAKRQLLEIRERDLRFNDDEARTFFAEVLHLSVSQPELTTIQTRTEGWITGLQLAGLALQSADTAFLAEFSGKHHYIMVT